MNEEKLKVIEEVIKKDNKNTSNVDELATRLQKVGGLSDKTAHIVAEEWKKVAGTIAIVLIGVFLYNQYKEGEIRRGHELGTALAGMQGQYRMIIGTQDFPKSEKAEDAEKLAKARESAKAAFDANYERAKEFGGGSIGGVAELYRVEMAMRQGRVAEAKSILEKRYGLDKVSGVTEPAPLAKLTASSIEQELASLLYVRVLLSEENVDMAAIKDRLKSLALSSQFVSSEALIAMARLSQTSEDKAIVENLAKKLKVVRPELESIVKEEIEKSGIKL